jgi:hypothetical protein
MTKLLSGRLSNATTVPATGSIRSTALVGCHPGSAQSFGATERFPPMTRSAPSSSIAVVCQLRACAR